jgi:GT2 family glycosyltransferase
VHADLEYVQFVDGDCALSPGWLEEGVPFLDGNSEVAIVCGRRRERDPEASVYNRLCDMEWNTPVGEASACGGDFLIRKRAFEEAGGFDPSLIAGEEPELCRRLRRLGWRVVRLDAEMTAHDAAITRFSQWWRRMTRSGYAYAEAMALHGRGPERYGVRDSLRIWLWAVGVPLLAIAPAASSRGGSLLLLALYSLLVLRMSHARVRLGDSWRDGLLYGCFVTIGRWGQLVGQLRYWLGRISDRPASLIEYKERVP